MVNDSKPSARPRMKPSHGCSGITSHACTRRSTTSARTSSNSSGNSARQHWPADARKPKQAMEKQESKQRFPTFPQPRRLRTINTYGIRVLRARSGLFLVHTYEPSKRPGQAYDINIFLIRHQKGAEPLRENLDNVAKLELYL